MNLQKMKKRLTIIVLMGTSILFSQQSKPSVLGNIDFFSLIESAPELKSTTEAAFEYACNNNINCQGDSQLELQYEKFKKKMENYTNQLASSIQHKTQSFYGNKNHDEIFNDTKNQVNQNELIKQMGGVDRISQMSEKEREEVAKRELAKNTSTLSFSPFSEEEMQRMMNDPEYAKQMASKYNNMIEKQKADMVMNQLEKKDIYVSNEEFENSLKKRQVYKNTMDINLFVAETTKQLINAFENYSFKIKEFKNTNGNHDELELSYAKEHAKIPLVVMGEGREPDPKMERELKLNYALKHKKRAALELAQLHAEHKNLISVINKTISDYYDFLDKNEYRVNGKMNNIIDGTNTELSLAQLEMSIGETIGKVAEICYHEVSSASDYEQVYQIILNTK
ncbi:hypothetical protein ACFSKN_04985 [Mariniflexile gromovii]|uniref:Outer membrane efflux protein n=1 Tax=Mariniflexile gromovii TaxID=362523 RepID=A0ABS4BQ84_9FLAO|nr:hypothetical protein [Mariniflexile gromovii]MBP0902230.1 hypothetical protein [Mariniflexile gromovii]